MVHTSSKPKVMSNAIVVADKIQKPCAKSTKGEKTATMKRAEDVQANLKSEDPSLVISMLPSHVSSCFWLGLPKWFCKKHMPKNNKPVILVDENAEEFKVVYLAERTGLSGGWRAFALKHALVEGDVIVFQVIKQWVIKVYIVRENGFTEIDGAISLLTLDPKPLEVVQEDSEENDVQLMVEDEVTTEQSGEGSDRMGSEIADGIELWDSVVRELPPFFRNKYYNLCRSQDSRLH